MALEERSDAADSKSDGAQRALMPALSDGEPERRA